MCHNKKHYANVHKSIYANKAAVIIYFSNVFENALNGYLFNILIAVMYGMERYLLMNENMRKK